MFDILLELDTNLLLFINKTSSGQEGVTIMTPAASTRIDDNKTKEPTIPREASRKT